jgi:hypothetical protein
MADESYRYANDGKAWSQMDIEDLCFNLRHGGSVEEAAIVLRRAGTVEEVRLKARGLMLID